GRHVQVRGFGGLLACSFDGVLENDWDLAICWCGMGLLWIASGASWLSWEELT
ncbi:hypothetical protein Dimus_034558, partial [Dionaea muscipula]